MALGLVQRCARPAMVINSRNVSRERGAEGQSADRSAEMTHVNNSVCPDSDRSAR